MADRLTKEQRKRCMSSIKSKNTGIEIRLRRALWAKGYRYRLNCNDIPGKPDIAIKKYRVPVFCDSEFFHGKDWENSLLPQLQRGSNSDFWIKKIRRNMERDCEVNEILQNAGWTVIRLWGKDIIHDADNCAERIIAEIEKKKEIRMCLRQK